MRKKTIAVIFGGASPEHGVSLVSAHAVISNLDSERYDIVLLGITRTGCWLRYYGDIENILNDTWFTDTQNCVPAFISPSRSIGGILELTPHGEQVTQLDAAFPVLHGKNGEDGTVQGLVELSGISLVGCGTLASALCMDKNKTKILLERAGVSSARSVVMRKGDALDDHRADIAQLAFPVFVKPVRAGSSYGISKVKDISGIATAIEQALLYDDEVIVEEAVDGFEVGCAVLGNDELTIGQVDEIELFGGFFDYEEKYNLHTAKVHLPARIDAETETRVRKTAAAAYAALGCRGFARVDLFVTPQKDVLFNEVNTIPGFTPNSRYPKMMAGIGLSYPEVLDRLIELGVAS